MTFIMFWYFFEKKPRLGFVFSVGLVSFLVGIRGCQPVAPPRDTRVKNKPYFFDERFVFL
jgi:hypothetical protein